MEQPPASQPPPRPQVSLSSRLPRTLEAPQQPSLPPGSRGILHTRTLIAPRSRRHPIRGPIFTLIPRHTLTARPLTPISILPTSFRIPCTPMAMLDSRLGRLPRPFRCVLQLRIHRPTPGPAHLRHSFTLQLEASRQATKTRANPLHRI